MTWHLGRGPRLRPGSGLQRLGPLGKRGPLLLVWLNCLQASLLKLQAFFFFSCCLFPKWLGWKIDNNGNILFVFFKPSPQIGTSMLVSNLPLACIVMVWRPSCVWVCVRRVLHSLPFCLHLVPGELLGCGGRGAPSCSCACATCGERCLGRRPAAPPE